MRLMEYLNMERGRGAAVALSVGVSPTFLSQIANGVRPAPADHCAAIERSTGGSVRRWDLRPTDWHRIWPELIGAEGAPAVPQAHEEARDAA